MLIAPSNEMEYRPNLEAHFSLLYELMVDCKYVPNAICETVKGIKRCITGSPDPFDNAILPCSQSEMSWDKLIEEQLLYFKAAEVPFSWHVDSESSSGLENALVQRGL